MAGEAQTYIRLAVVNLKFTQNVTNTIPILSVPDGANFQLELLSIHTLVGDSFVAGGTLSLQYGIADGGVDALLASTFNPESGGGLGSADFVSTQLVAAVQQILDPGDMVYAVCIADNNAVTFQNEISAMVEFRVLRRS